MYGCLYVSIQTLNVLLVPITIVLFAIPPYFTGIIPLIVLICLRLERCAVCTRVGCLTGSRPVTEKQFVRYVRQGKIPVGSGWSFYLQRTPPSKKIMFTRQFQGQDGEWWKAGTTIAQVAKFYANQDLAFPSLPSIETITLGSWIWTGSHGSSGDQGKPSSHCFDKIKIVALDKNIKIMSYKDFDVSNALAIVSVSFDTDRMSKNIWLHKRKIKYDITEPSSSVSEWLKPSYQRAAFVGTYVTLLQWSQKKIFKGKEHEDPYCCGSYCLWVQSDPCSACRVCGPKGCCVEAEEKYASRVQLYEVNRFVPGVWNFSLLMLFGFGHRNYELLCALPKSKSIKDFFTELIQALLEMHAKTGGRSEIRYSKNMFFLDISLSSQFEEPFRVLEKLDVKAFSTHMGKFEPKVMTTMRQMTNKKLFQFAARRETNKLQF